jgi:hypothetical protein
MRQGRKGRFRSDGQPWVSCRGPGLRGLASREASTSRLEIEGGTPWVAARDRGPMGPRTVGVISATCDGTSACRRSGRATSNEAIFVQEATVRFTPALARGTFRGLLGTLHDAIPGAARETHGRGARRLKRRRWDLLLRSAPECSATCPGPGQVPPIAATSLQAGSCWRECRPGNPRMGVLQEPTAATFGTLARLSPDSE